MFTLNEVRSVNFIGKTIDASNGEEIFQLESPKINSLVNLLVSKSDTSANKVIVKYEDTVIKELDSNNSKVCLKIIDGVWTEV